MATDRIVGLSPKVDLSLHSAHSARSNAQSGSESSAETMHGRACEGPDSPLGTVVRHWDKAYSCYGSRQLLCEQTDFVFAVRQRLVSDENSTCQIPIRHDILSDGDVKV